MTKPRWKFIEALESASEEEKLQKEQDFEQALNQMLQLLLLETELHDAKNNFNLKFTDDKNNVAYYFTVHKSDKPNLLDLLSDLKRENRALRYMITGTIEELKDGLARLDDENT